MDSPTSFSSLPPELVTKICRDSALQKKDLIALRLTSKSQGIHLSATKEIAQRYFRNIDLVYTHYSLQAFVEICKHTVYGPSVRKIRLSCTRFEPNRFEEESKGHFDDIAVDNPRGRHRYLDNIRLLVNRCDEEENLKRSGDAEDLLAVAFTALSRWHHPLEIAVSSWESGALGQRRTFSPDDLGEHVNWECDILGTVSLLYHAAVRGTCAVQALQVHGAVWDNLVDSSIDSLSSLAQLSELKLDIWPLEDVEIELLAGLDGMASKLLENATHLTPLHVESAPLDSNPEYLRKVFTTMSRMRLEKITLTWIDLDRFSPFDNQIVSLRHLELIGCKADEGLKDDLLSIQKNFPRLEYFRLFRPWSSQEIEFQGVQGVSDGVDKLMQSRLNRYNNPGMSELWGSDED